jgi:16S rRNA (guanine966-N2)-methyltransferase
LFAGSGIMGIEAASRGAKEIIYVEKSPKVAEMLKENLANFDFKNEIFVCDALKALDILKGRQFNIIFADPPYASGIIPDILEKVRNNGLLADEGVLIVEYASKLSITESAEKNGFNEIKYKTYGDTAVSFLSTKTE